MVDQWFQKSRVITLTPLLVLALLVGVACGTAAPAPQVVEQEVAPEAVTQEEVVEQKVAPEAVAEVAAPAPAAPP